MAKNTEYAANFSSSERKRFRGFAILSTITGCVSEQFVDSNTIIILYLVMLGGSESFSMFSSASSSVMRVLLSIPFAGVANKIGLRVSYSSAVFMGVLAYLLIAGAPFFGTIATYVIIGGCMLYAFSRPLYGATWYPLCDAFLLRSERRSFFGSMRFIYMTFNSLLIFGIGCLMGKNPPIYLIQIIIAFAAVMLYGRKYFLDKLPINPDFERSSYDMPKAFAISVRNSGLTGFAFYICMLQLAVTAGVPLAVIYMKIGLQLSAFTVMTITSIGLFGYISAYSVVAKVMNKLGTKYFQLLTHCIFIAVFAFMFFIKPDSSAIAVKMGISFYLNGIACAFLMCLTSNEILALAKPTNKLMASAFVTTFENIGICIGRIGTTVILAIGALSETWTVFGQTYTKYNFLFALCCFLTIFCLLFLMISPSVVPKHKDYYEPSN